MSVSPNERREVPAARARVSTRAWIPALLASTAVAALFFGGLASIPLTSPNEGLYAEVAREMAETGDPIIPRADGVVYLEKPPLLYWLIAASFRVFGTTTFAARFPSALAAAATAGLLAAAARRLFGTTAGIVAALAFATSLGSTLLARQVLFDALLTFWTSAALLAFWFGTSAEIRPARRRTILLAGYASLGLAVLTKGLVGAVLPILVIGAYALFARDRRLRAAWSLPGALLFLAIALPWHVAAALRQKEFTWFYFVNEHWLRFLGHRRPPDFHQDPIYAPALALLFLIFPWTVLLPAAANEAISPSSRKERRSETIFLMSWALAPAIFFTVSRTRTYYYMLPIVPPLALAVAMLWSRLDGDAREQLRSRWFLFPIGGFALLAAAGWVFCGAAPDDGTRGGAFRAIVFASGFWLVLGLFASIFLARRRMRPALFVCLAASAGLTLTTALVYAVKLRSDAFVSQEPAARLLLRHLPPGGAVVAMEGKFENHSSFAFFLPRRLYPILAVEGHGGGDLEFGGHLPGAPRVFVSTAELFEIAAARPVFYLAKTPSRLALPNCLKILRRDAESTLWSNCVPPNRPHPPTNSPFELGPESAR